MITQQRESKLRRLKLKGLLLNNTYHLGFLTSIFDNTSGKYEPVTSSIDQFQEPRTIAYQHAVDMGTTAPGIGFIG